MISERRANYEGSVTAPPRFRDTLRALRSLIPYNPVARAKPELRSPNSSSLSELGTTNDDAVRHPHQSNCA
jgi:hypothetical protein